MTLALIQTKNTANRRYRECDVFEQCSLEEAKARTFIGAFHGSDGDVILVFYPDSFVYVQARNGCEGGDAELRDDERLEPTCFSNRVILESGIITAEELEALADAKRKHWGAQRETQERRKYEELKRKFEGTP